MHKDAPLAHFASVATQQQGKFWEFHDKLFANQSKIKSDDLMKYAREIGLDTPRPRRRRRAGSPGVSDRASSTLR